MTDVLLKRSKLYKKGKSVRVEDSRGIKMALYNMIRAEILTNFSIIWVACFTCKA